MTDTETPAESDASDGLRGQAIALVALLAGIIAIVVVTFAFSTSNTPMSVDGDRATYSKNLDD